VRRFTEQKNALFISLSHFEPEEITPMGNSRRKPRRVQPMAEIKNYTLNFVLSILLHMVCSAWCSN
jgi:hypothetical protein